MKNIYIARLKLVITFWPDNVRKYVNCDLKTQVDWKEQKREGGAE